MRRPKIERINSDIEKIKNRIVEYKAMTAKLQKRLRTLEIERDELNDAQTLEIVRREKISDAELNELIRSIRENKDAEPSEKQNKTGGNTKCQ